MTYFYGQSSTASRLQSHYGETAHFLTHKPLIVPTEFFPGKNSCYYFEEKNEGVFLYYHTTNKPFNEYFTCR